MVELKLFELDEYLSQINVPYKDIKSHEELSDYISEKTNGSLWAYSIDELDYCIKEVINFVFVKLENEICLAECRSKK